MMVSMLLSPEPATVVRQPPLMMGACDGWDVKEDEPCNARRLGDGPCWKCGQA
jgi:hypothetical protein